MKKYIAIISFAALSLFAVSCEGFLEIPSETKFDSSSIFSSYDKAEMAVLAAYPAGYNREMWYQLGMGTDEVISTEGSTNSKNQIGNYVLSGGITGTSTYTSAYAAIEYANVCIDGLSKVNISGIDRLVGECYCIRAMAYLNLVRYWGDVPYTTVPVASLESFYSSRVSRDEILDGCVKDLQDAVKLLPWKSEISDFTPERYCKESAYALLARVALYDAGYSLRWDMNTVPYAVGSVKIAKRDDSAKVKELNKIAMDACKAVMDRGSFSLDTDYANIFRDLVNGRYNKESILEQGQYGTNCNVETGYTNAAFCHASSMYGKAQPAMKMNPALYFDYEEGDQRRDVSICTYAVDDKSNLHLHPYGGFYVGKFRVSWKSSIGTATNKRDINWPWFRYDHILLMYAEAANEYNGAPTTEAINALKQIRIRAFGSESLIGTIPTDHDGFLNAIIEENKLEFAGESWRRTELCRWGIQYETLMATKDKLVKIAGREGKYANFDRYRAYKPVAGVFNYSDTVVPYVGAQTLEELNNKLSADAPNWTIVDMYNNKVAANTDSALQMAGYSSGEWQGNTGFSDLAWYKDLFRGLTKNKTEICPLSQTSVIDVNPGLKDQQAPGY